MPGWLSRTLTIVFLACLFGIFNLAWVLLVSVPLSVWSMRGVS